MLNPNERHIKRCEIEGVFRYACICTTPPKIGECKSYQNERNGKENRGMVAEVCNELQ